MATLKQKAWQPSDMITEQRVMSVARSLFPDDYHVGDCMAEFKREGLPCQVCAQRNRAWAERLEQVRKSLFTAFGFPIAELTGHSDNR